MDEKIKVVNNLALKCSKTTQRRPKNVKRCKTEKKMRLKNFLKIVVPTTENNLLTQKEASKANIQRHKYMERKAN